MIPLKRERTRDSPEEGELPEAALEGHSRKGGSPQMYLSGRELVACGKLVVGTWKGCGGCASGRGSPAQSCGAQGSRLALYPNRVKASEGLTFEPFLAKIRFEASWISFSTL